MLQKVMTLLGLRSKEQPAVAALFTADRRKFLTVAGAAVTASIVSPFDLSGVPPWRRPEAELGRRKVDIQMMAGDTLCVTFNSLTEGIPDVVVQFDADRSLHIYEAALMLFADSADEPMLFLLTDEDKVAGRHSLQDVVDYYLETHANYVFRRT